MFKPWQVTLFLLVVALGVVGFIFWYYSAPSTGITAEDANTQSAAAPTDANANAQTAAVSAGASTDAALDADLNAADAQLKTVNTDSASVDQSLNDKPVTQTE